MNKQTYLAKLAQLLAPLPEQERQDALNYYEEYFDAAGPEAEDATAAELGDEELRRQALSLCSRVVEGQREDGSFGAEGETFAARGRMLRALAVAYSMSGDKQLLTFMLRYMKYLHDTLRVRSLSAEDAMHTADTLEAGILLYNITGQKAILSVLMMLVSQGADYTSLYHAFPYRTPISRSFSADELLDALAHEDESGYTHHLLRSANGANLCEGLRASALCGVLTGSGKHLSAAEAGLARMNKAHGAAGGGVTADPLLAGTHPSRGVSAVSACELAASLETLLTCPGGEFGADQLEQRKQPRRAVFASLIYTEHNGVILDDPAYAPT